MQATGQTPAPPSALIAALLRQLMGGRVRPRLGARLVSLLLLALGLCGSDGKLLEQAAVAEQGPAVLLELSLEDSPVAPGLVALDRAGMAWELFSEEIEFFDPEELEDEEPSSLEDGSAYAPLWVVHRRAAAFAAASAIAAPRCPAHANSRAFSWSAPARGPPRAAGTASAGEPGLLS